MVSTVNFSANDVASNGATIQLDASGGLCVYANVATDLVIDVNGSYGPTADARFTPVTPVRLLDTRESGQRLSAGQTLSLQVGGAGGVSRVIGSDGADDGGEARAGQNRAGQNRAGPDRRQEGAGQQGPADQPDPAGGAVGPHRQPHLDPGASVVVDELLERHVDLREAVLGASPQVALTLRPLHRDAEGGRGARAPPGAMRGGP